MKLASVIAISFVVLASGCATNQLSPEAKAQAEKRKGEVLEMSVTLQESGDFSRSCGYAKPNESVECSQNMLRRKLGQKAVDYCGTYKFGEIRWQGTGGALYNRSTAAATEVTCMGPGN